MPLISDAVPQRRRGRVLEDALLDAAWEELTERGYDAFTIDGAAARADTSRAVLYRRWPTKQDLMYAAVARAVGKDVIIVPDTGSLRGDVIALLRLVNQRRIRTAIELFANLGSFYRATGTGIGDLRDLIPGGRDSIMDVFIQRATDRGEIRSGQISTRVARLPMDLFRQEVLMTLRPVAEEDIEWIVNTIFLPLVEGMSAPKEDD